MGFVRKIYDFSFFKKILFSHFFWNSTFWMTMRFGRPIYISLYYFYSIWFAASDNLHLKDKRFQKFNSTWILRNQIIITFSFSSPTDESSAVILSRLYFIALSRKSWINQAPLRKHTSCKHQMNRTTNFLLKEIRCHNEINWAKRNRRKACIILPPE